MIAGADGLLELVNEARRIVVIQADNPDGDSVASALSLEQILGDMGKEVHLYCGVNVPEYLRFIPGWDRIDKHIPPQFDASIIVDTSAHILLDKLEQSPARSWVASRPCAVLDHHSQVVCDIPYASVVINEPDFVATGELIYEIANQLNWMRSTAANELIAQSILADSLGLTSEGTTSATYRRMADLIDAGVDRSKLEEARRALSKMPETVFRYKARLIERTEFYLDNQVALVVIPEDELYTVGTLYNPKILIFYEMSQVQGVKLAIVIKTYKRRLTGAIRSMDSAFSAAKLAEHFGGGGHWYSAGFKLEGDIDVASVKTETIQEAISLLQ